MNTKDNNRSSGLLTLMLFLVFAVCIVSVLLGATEIYERLSLRGAEAEDKRVTAMFVAQKIRQNDVRGNVRLAELEGRDALVITEELAAGRFCTWIYCHEGWLHEILLTESAVPRPGDGERLIEAQAMELELNDALLSIELTDSRGNVTRQKLVLRSGGQTG